MKKLFSLITVFTVATSLPMDWVNKAAEKGYQLVDTIAGEQVGDQVRAVGNQELDLKGNPSFCRRSRQTVRQVVQALSQNQIEQEESHRQEQREAKRAQEAEKMRRIRKTYKKKTVHLREKYGKSGRSRQGRQRDNSTRRTPLSDLQRSDQGISNIYRSYNSTSQRQQLQRLRQQSQQKLTDAKRGMFWSFLGFLGGCVSTVWGARNLLYGDGEHFKRDATITTAGIVVSGVTGYKTINNFLAYRKAKKALG